MSDRTAPRPLAIELAERSIQTRPMLAGVREVLVELLLREGHVDLRASSVDGDHEERGTAEHRHVILATNALQPLQAVEHLPTADDHAVAVAFEESHEVAHVVGAQAVLVA
eukprot:CAMPEP_0183374490 /NCGR_PEP_ID=MMETSP0164_2-20130417/114659_1 /TAXON_ID=221442 /ORGANISM="Coccolithus pelagicus ssp braarudi, Strain PLY182g" /LENGTH=110 /DNA_ID=CAMNT_0025551533 /DNA_START=223 /DNA_END=556 /DNA_ORIENTATION=-